jgi:hypothetical protein
MPVPRYAIPVGSELRLHTRSLTVTGQDEHGYTVEDTASGSTTFMSFMQLVDHLKMPGVRVDILGATTGRRMESRLGGFISSEGLPEMQRRLAKFHLASAEAMHALREDLRRQTGRPDAEISVRYAEAKRERIRDLAQDILGEKIHLTPPKGGYGHYLTLYRGRTLVKYARAAHGVGPGESSLDAVTPLDHLKGNNGPGLRNAVVIGSVLAAGGAMTIGRAYSPTDKPYIERMFGTLESVLLSLIHGYTGRRPGHLPAYDAVANGVLDLELLQEILTRFMIDEYPSMRHGGFGMGMRRPIEVFKEINETRGCIPPIDADRRRIALGWEQEVKASDEGVKVFGIFFNSDRLQALRDKHRVAGKVRVFVDPDDLSSATVLLPKVVEPVQVQIQCTAFADMTLPEVQDLLALLRKEDPTATELYEDVLFRLRRDRDQQLRQIAKDKGLTRSYSSMEDCTRKAKSLLAGSRIIPSTTLAGTTRPGSILDGPGPEAFIMPIADEMLIEGAAIEPPVRGSAGEQNTLVPLPTVVDSAVSPVPVDRHEPIKPAAAPMTAKASRPSAGATLGRPKNLKELE